MSFDNGAKLEDGTYIIQHVSHKTLAVVPHGSAPFADITSGLPRKDRRGIEIWEIERQPNDSYTLKHVSTGRFATGGKIGDRPALVTPQTESGSGQLWTIQETREKNVYFIQSLGSPNCWTLEGEDVGYSISLRPESTNKYRAWWKFVSTPMPPQAPSSPAEVSQVAFSPPKTTSVSTAENIRLSGDFAFKVALTGAYVKITPSGQLEASSQYLDASAIFTVEEKRGRCALQGSNYMYIVNHVGDAACDDIGADEDHRLYFDIVAKSNETVSFTTWGFGRMWYLASEGSRLFFRPGEGEETQFNVVRVPPSARPFPPSFAGDVTIRDAGGKTLSITPDNSVAFSGFTADSKAKFKVEDDRATKLIGQDGKAVNLTPDGKIKYGGSSSSTQGRIHLHERPGGKVLLAASGYPWQNGETWFVSTRPDDPSGTVSIKKVEDETCHFSAEDHARNLSNVEQQTDSGFNEIDPSYLSGKTITIRDRKDRYLWVSQDGQLHIRSQSLGDKVLFHIAKVDGSLHIRGGADDADCITRISTSNEYASCESAEQSLHLRFHFLQVSKASNEVILALGDDKGEYLSLHPGEAEGSLAILDSPAKSCCVKVDIYDEASGRLIPFKPNEHLASSIASDGSTEAILPFESLSPIGILAQ